jgi:hypothetical protein
MRALAENPLAHFEESSGTITKVFTHKWNQLLAKTRSSIEFQTTQKIKNETLREPQLLESIFSYIIK